MDFIKALWRGKKSLAFTFWRMYVMMHLAFTAFYMLLDMLGVYNEITDVEYFLLQVFEVATFIYTMFILVCLGRCAANYTNNEEINDTQTGWGRLVVILVAFGWINLLFQFATMVWGYN